MEMKYVVPDMAQSFGRQDGTATCEAKGDGTD